MVRRLWKIEPFMKCIIFRRKNDATVLHRPPVSCYAKLQKLIQNRYKQIFCWGMEIDNSTGSRERERKQAACLFLLYLCVSLQRTEMKKKLPKVKSLLQLSSYFKAKEAHQISRRKRNFDCFHRLHAFQFKKYRSCVLAAYECECECVYKFHCCVCMCELVSAIRR